MCRCVRRCEDAIRNALGLFTDPLCIHISSHVQWLHKHLVDKPSKCYKLEPCYSRVVERGFISSTKILHYILLLDEKDIMAMEDYIPIVDMKALFNAYAKHKIPMDLGGRKVLLRY